MNNIKWFQQRLCSLNGQLLLSVADPKPLIRWGLGQKKGTPKGVPISIQNARCHRYFNLPANIEILGPVSVNSMPVDSAHVTIWKKQLPWTNSTLCSLKFLFLWNRIFFKSTISLIAFWHKSIFLSFIFSSGGAACSCTLDLQSSFVIQLVLARFGFFQPGLYLNKMMSQFKSWVWCHIY